MHSAQLRIWFQWQQLPLFYKYFFKSKLKHVSSLAMYMINQSNHCAQVYFQSVKAGKTNNTDGAIRFIPSVFVFVSTEIATTVQNNSV